MTDQLDIVVTPTDDHPTAQVLAIGALLALEWAAPYVNVTIGHVGERCCVDHHIWLVMAQSSFDIGSLGDVELLVAESDCVTAVEDLN